MDGLMIALAVLFLVARLIGRAAKGADGGRRDGRVQTPPPATPSPWGRAEMFGGEADGQPRSIEEVFAEARRRLEGTAGEGEGRADERGCLGGSIEHGVHEGEGYGEGGRPQAAPTGAPGDLAALSAGGHTWGSMSYVPATEYHPVAFGGLASGPARARRTRFTRTAARNAVVMAEVLGKPVSLR